jgi:hypothetical protein
MNCYKTTNNKHFTAPPRMADGRHFTDYRPTFDLNTKIQNDNNVDTSYNYRMLLTNNAEQIMELNRKQSFLMNGVSNCKQPYETGTMLPELNKVRCDVHKCEVVHNYDGGIGTGRIYNTNDVAASNCLDGLRQPAEEAPGAQCAPMDDLATYYPLNSNAEGANRVAVPGGGNIAMGGDPNVVA